MIDRRNRKRVCRLTAFAGIIILVILHFSEHEENLNRSKEIFQKLVQNSVKIENKSDIEDVQPVQNEVLIEVPPTPHPQPQADFKPPAHEIQEEDKNNSSEEINSNLLSEENNKQETENPVSTPSYPDVYNDEILKIRQVTTSINFDGKVYRYLRKKDYFNNFDFI